MKQVLFTVLLLGSFWNYGVGQIQFTGCTGSITGASGMFPMTLSLFGTTNDAGTIRNTYESPVPGPGCSAGTCSFRVQWNIGAGRWEIILNGSFVIYANTTASFPDPPDLSLGTWTSLGPCGGQAINTWTGNVQNTVSSGAPEIDLRGNGNSIADGDATPSTTDDTDFGNINLGSNDVHTFTIDNSAGTAALTVSTINISGTNAGDFVRGGITLPANIAAGATTTFTLTFTPSGAGVRNATVTVNNDDANEAVYDYAVRGTGVGAPEINIIGNGNSIVDGDATPSTTDDTDFGNVNLSGNDVHTFTIDNTAGTTALTVSSINLSGANAADFLVGTFPGSVAAGATGNFTVTFLPGAVGVRNATVTVNNNDANEAAYDYAIRGTGVGAPEINMLGLGNSIVDGDVTPSTADDTDFGNINMGGNDVHTFTIDNTAGTAALTVSSINVSGANAADFVLSIFPGSIAAGTSGNFTVTFTPSATGVRNATVTVNNNDANEGVYDFAVQGNGVIPATALDFDGTGYVALPTTVSVSQLNEFTVEAWVNWDGTGNGCIYSEGNTGSINPMFSIIPRSINGGGMEVVLRDNSATGLVQQPTVGVIPTGTWTHVAVVRTSATNVKVYVNGVLTDDLTFAAPAAWTVDAITTGVRQRSSFDSPFNGDIDELRVWNRALCPAEITARKDCELSGTETNLVAYYDFNQGFAAANNSTETTLLDRQTNTAAKNGTLTNVTLTGATGNWVDGSANGVTGTCTPALLSEINLVGNAVSIVDGDNTPDVADDTDFGNVNLGNNDVHTFTIDNSTGTDVLNVSSIVVSGTNLADFVVGGITFPSAILAGNSSTFTLTFTPSALGARTATVTVNSDDCDEPVYDFAVQGTGIAALPSIAITEWMTNPIGSDATDEWIELHNFGATPVDVQNWDLEDEDSDDDPITANSLIIPAGGYLILAKNKAAFEAQWLNGCVSDFVVQIPGITLANGADEIIIKDASNNIIWSVAYQNDDATGRAAQYTEAPNFTNRIWGSKASTGVDRSGNDPATGSLGYENNNVTADPNVMTSTTGDMASPFDGTYAPPAKDIVRGDVLDFDGTNDFVELTTNFSSIGTGDFTIECWASWDALAGNQFLWAQDRSGVSSPRFAVRMLNGTLLFSSNVQPTAISGSINSTNEWNHIALVRQAGTTSMYANGLLIGSTTANYNLSVNNFPFRIGSRGNAVAQNPMNGQVDEFRVWNTARTANEIRENMHLTLKDCPTSLLAYYQMNDGTGSATLTDHSGNGNVGTLTNMNPTTDWIAGGVNVGNDAGNTSNSQTITTAAGVSTQNFTNANATMRFFAHSGAEDITVTYQAFTPNGIVGANGVNIIQNPMWTVNKSSATETMIVDYTFMFAGGTFTNTNPTKYALYHRAMNSEGNWTKIATAGAMTASSATFGKISLGGQFMVVQESENDISDVRGNMYTFDGVNDHISFANNLAIATDYTVETWFKTSAIGSQTIITLERSSSIGSYLHFALQPAGELRYLHRVPAGSSGGVDVFSPLAYNDGAWHHAAIVKENAQMSMYVDGVLVSSGTNANHINDNVRPIIGQLTPSAAARFFNGSMDEFRIWNVARSQNEIRENMHLTLKGNETGLVSYYQFNNDDPIGTVSGVKDATGTNNGTTQNMATTAYLASEVAVAGGTSDRLTIGAGGVYTFPNTDVAIEFGANTPSGEIVVSRLETEKPHGWETIGGDVDNEYFVVNNYGANASFDPLLDITFDRLSYVSPLDVGLPQASTPLQIYKRDDNAFGATWGTSFGGADNATAGTNAMISFNATNAINSFSQIVLANNGNNSDLPVELMKFDAARLNADKVQLDWATATEINNEGFYVERMLETEAVFRTVGYLEGQGNSVAIVNYQLLDENAFAGISYYRLRQVDFDGTTTYSEIKAVEGRDNKSEYMDVSIYPNPVQNELKIRFNELPKDIKSAQVKITNVDGKVLSEFTAGVQSYQLLEVEDVDQLSAGLYLLSIDFNNKERIVQKFIKE